MGFALDHVVIAVKDLERAVADYRFLGFTVLPGGVHHGGISHNALVVFADGAYFELIAYRQPNPGNLWWTLLTEEGEGVVDFALLPDDTQEEMAAAQGRGLGLLGPVAGGRLRPDGIRLDWQIVRPETRDLPFWCGDITARHLRVPEGDHRRHANGAQGIALLGVYVTDVATSADRYRALMGPDAIDRSGGRVRIAFGGTTIELVEPDGEEAQSRLQARGEGVASIVLSGPAAAQLDQRRAHGATLRIGG